MKFICVIILTTSIATASSEGLPKRTLKSIPVVDALIQRLEAEEWADEACYRDTLQILYGVKNDTLWATWVWDSMQPPVGVFYGTGVHFGNFDQCINTPLSSHQEISTQYCIVEAKVQPKESREFGAYDSADEYLNLTHLPDAELITVDPADCQTSVPKPYPGKLFAYVSVLGVLLVTAILSTVYTQLYATKENSITDVVAKSFCLARNWNDLFKVNKNEIRVLNGMRVLTSVLVVLSHQVLFSLFTPTIMTNSVEVDEMFNDEIGQVFVHVDLIVDTFFSISGLLLVRGLFAGRQKKLRFVLIKRYLRLIGPYAAVTFYIICVARYTGSGPIWLRSNANEESVCEKYWWKNVFMMNNDMKTMCISVAWYVSCDYHLALLTVLLFWVYRKHRKTGITTFIAVIVTLTVQLAVKAYTKGLPLVVFNDINKVAEIRDYELMNEVYIRWYDRAGSYFVGIAMGALMTIYKPAEHRNVLSKTTSFAFVFASLFLMVKVASINYWFSGGPVLIAMAIATKRVVWAIAICGLIAASEYGNAGIISDFLGSSVFVPLGKLTYGIYMTHFFIIQRNVHVGRTPFQFKTFNMTIYSLGTTVVASAVALVLYLLVEAPCINLSNVCFSERNEKNELNGEIKTNGAIRQNGTNGILPHNGTNGITKLKAL